ncbi:MAG: class I SAM-dependent methyltransferase [Patescibacteria group bacterium]|nr:class I SAM-dependent methyltransferase [Patescibacteria group bacterium]
MGENKYRICPVENAGVLDISLRKWIHNPQKILAPFVKTGMTVLDFGAGPGFFTLELARLVGESGKVIAADLQDGMLEKIWAKIKNTDLGKIITLHKVGEDKIGLDEKVDFALVFYVLHELPNQGKFLAELKTILKLGAKALIVEPKFHVSRKAFQNSVELMKKLGFEIIETPKIFMSRAVVITTSK